MTAEVSSHGPPTPVGERHNVAANNQQEEDFKLPVVDGAERDVPEPVPGAVVRSIVGFQVGAAGQGDGSGSCAAGDKICAAAKERFLFLSEEAAKASARGEKAPSDPDGADNSLARNSEPLDSSGFRAILRNAGIEYVRFFMYLIRPSTQPHLVRCNLATTHDSAGTC